MIRSICNTPSFGSKVILNGFGTGDYKNIKMPGHSKETIEATKKQIADLRENSDNNTVTLSYNKEYGHMSMLIQEKKDGHHYSNGPLYFIPHIGSIERNYARMKDDLWFDK